MSATARSACAKLFRGVACLFVEIEASGWWTATSCASWPEAGISSSRSVEAFYDELAHKPYDRALLARFAELVTADRPVLDLGCGPGHIAGHLRGLGLAVRGVDLSPRMIEVARRRQPEIEFEVGDMLELAWPADSLAGAVAFYSLIHLVRADVPRALAGLAQAIAPGGPLLIAVHAGEGMVREEEVLGRPVPMAATLFSLEEMSGYVESAGFKLHQAETRPPYPEEYPSERVYVLATRP